MVNSIKIAEDKVQNNMVNEGPAPVPPARKGQQQISIVKQNTVKNTPSQSQKQQQPPQSQQQPPQSQQQPPQSQQQPPQSQQPIITEQKPDTPLNSTSQNCQTETQAQDKISVDNFTTVEQQQNIVKQSSNIQQLQSKLQSTDHLPMTKTSNANRKNSLQQAKYILSQHVARKISNNDQPQLTSKSQQPLKIGQPKMKNKLTQNAFLQNNLQQNKQVHINLSNKRQHFQKSKSVDLITHQKQDASLSVAVSTISLKNTVHPLHQLGESTSSPNMSKNNLPSQQNSGASPDSILISTNENDPVIHSTLVLKPTSVGTDNAKLINNQVSLDALVADIKRTKSPKDICGENIKAEVKQDKSQQTKLVDTLQQIVKNYLQKGDDKTKEAEKELMPVLQVSKLKNTINKSENLQENIGELIEKKVVEENKVEIKEKTVKNPVIFMTNTASESLENTKDCTGAVETQIPQTTITITPAVPSVTSPASHPVVPQTTITITPAIPLVTSPASHPVVRIEKTDPLDVVVPLCAIKNKGSTIDNISVNTQTEIEANAPSLTNKIITNEDLTKTQCEDNQDTVLHEGNNFLKPNGLGKEFVEIPGLITPPPSPPILSMLQEHETEIKTAIKGHLNTLEVKASAGQELPNFCDKNALTPEDNIVGPCHAENKTNSSDLPCTPNNNTVEEKGSNFHDTFVIDPVGKDESKAIIRNNSENLNCAPEEVVVGKIILGASSHKTYPDSNNNVNESFLKLYGKELSTLEAKYQEEVNRLTLALAEKQQELSSSKQEAEKQLKLSEERRGREHQDLQDKLDKEIKELEELHIKEKEERERQELEEQQLKQTETAKKEEADKSLKDGSGEGGNEDTEEDDEEESEAESNKRKIEKLQNELLLLKQQNEDFEEMVREKHRRQIEMEIEIAEIKREVNKKEAMVESVKLELCYSKNETEVAKARTKKMEEEIAEHKERVDTLERELDTSERELRRMEILQEKLRVTEVKRNDLQGQLDDIEIERDEEIKIIQDALDEAAQEREELLTTFEKEIEKLNSMNAAREAQMLEDFECKLKELELLHRHEKEKLTENKIHRGKRQPDEEEIRQRIDKMKSEINSEWEDKLRSECSRLKGELDNLHAEEKHLAVESIRVQKEQELQNLKKTFDGKAEELDKDMSNLKDSLAAKDVFYRKELEDMRGVADRDVWDLRRKLQKLDESTYERQQYLEDKHREDLERLREDYVDRMSSMKTQLSSFDVSGLTELRDKLEKRHKEQMEYLGEQHRNSMVRLRDELEADRIQAAEDARVIVSKHYEYINLTITEKLTESLAANTQYHDEIEAIRFALTRREEVIRSLEDDIAKLRSSKSVTPSSAGYPNTVMASPNMGGTIGGASSPSASSGFSHEGSQGSGSSQDRVSTDGVDEEGHKSSGLLGKVFGGGWFSGPKNKDNTSPGHSSASGSATRRGSSAMYKQAW